MIRNSVRSKTGTSKLVHGSEILLIIFAAFLLIAAAPPKATNAKAGPVNVNMPAPQPVTEPTSTAIVKADIKTQTTAFLTIKEQTPKQTKP